jgi:hypothetical protein
MADKKISALTSLAQGDVAVSTDVLPIVDTSAPETKKVTAAALVGAGLTAGVTNVDINSGSIDGTTIGANSAAAGTFTNLTASGTVSFSGATVSNGGSVTTVDINGGTIDGASIGASSASTGSFTTLTTSSTVTLNGGTANGVLYLNGSKVATSGSALTFDGTNLGVGTSPVASYKIAVNGDYWQGNGSGTLIGTIKNASGWYEVASSSNVLGVQLTSAATTPIRFLPEGSEAMRLTSTGLGIGTSSPAYKLDVRGVSASGNGTITTGISWDTDGLIGAFSNHGLGFLTNGTVKARLDTSGNLGLGVTPSAWQSGATAVEIGNAGYLAFTGSTSGGYIYNNAYLAAGGNTYKATGYASALGIGPSGEFRFFTAPSGTAGNTISFTQAMTLDASGNLGLGTTAPLFTLDISQAAPRIRQTAATGANSSLIQLVNTGGTAYIGLDSSSGGLTTAYSLNLLHSGAYPICFSTSSTERARITSGGDLLVGATSNGGTNAKFEVDYAGSYGAALVNTNDTSATKFYAFYNSAFGECGSIARVTTTNAVTYNTTSDYRLKTLISSITNSGDRIDALNPVEYEWKENGKRARGFFAHEFQQVYADSVTGEKDAVDKNGNPIYQAMQAATSEVIADLVAEIKSLRARVAQLESK